jgi:hypothetical protein
VNGAVQAVDGECSVRKVTRFQVASNDFDVFEFGAYLRDQSIVSQWARSANAARLALLTSIGPWSRTRTTGLCGDRLYDPKPARSNAENPTLQQ